MQIFYKQATYQWIIVTVQTEYNFTNTVPTLTWQVTMHGYSFSTLHFGGYCGYSSAYSQYLLDLNLWTGSGILQLFFLNSNHGSWGPTVFDRSFSFFCILVVRLKILTWSNFETNFTKTEGVSHCNSKEKVSSDIWSCQCDNSTIIWPTSSKLCSTFYESICVMMHWEHDGKGSTWAQKLG